MLKGRVFRLLDREGRLAEAIYSARESWKIRKLRTWLAQSTPGRVDGTRPKVIGILAGYGNGSYGDYFIGIGFAEAAKRNGIDIVLLGRGNETTAFSVRGIECRYVGDGASHLGEFDEVLGDLRGLVLGGGGLFEDRVDARLSQSLASGYAARGIRAHEFGIPLIVHGVGVEERQYRSWRVESLLYDLLSTAEIVNVRDRKSKIACVRRGVQGTVVVDPAVLAFGPRLGSSQQQAGTFGFIPFARRVWPFSDTPTPDGLRAQWKEWQSCALKISEHSVRRVLIVPFHFSDMPHLNKIREIFEATINDCEVVIVPYRPNAPLEVLDELSICERVFTMRYHGFMAAYFAGVDEICAIGSSQKLQVTRELHMAGKLGDAWSSDRAEEEIGSLLRSFV